MNFSQSTSFSSEIACSAEIPESSDLKLNSDVSDPSHYTPPSPTDSTLLHAFSNPVPVFLSPHFRTTHNKHNLVSSMQNVSAENRTITSASLFFLTFGLKIDVLGAIKA
ncbi:hypothetical protein OIU85_002194 [Salix viminalis]|uniref:Uncharacterized protein n=1 Tax=Salix viminalis TaxID=40686 RepID=A0A9Q0VMV5_SALVM|nr:hypothetical protein OIU85_002194 [Salix viminalis]